MNNTSILPRFQNWKKNWANPNEMDEFEYISYNIHPEDFLLLSNLLFPELKEIEGMIVLNKNFSQETFRSMSSRSQTEIEKDFNSLKVFELFEGCTDQIDESMFKEIGTLIQTSWNGYLSTKYPQKSFTVELVLDDNNYGPIVRFYQN